MKTGGKLVTKDQFSAGGVAFREISGNIEIAIILTEPEHRWQLPKGMIDRGETPEEAALREVREEAGIDTDIIDTIDRTEYWYVGAYDGERKRYHKRVHWFLMRYISGSVADHDHEVAEARWAAVPEALELLVFKNERDIVEKALEMINSL